MGLNGDRLVVQCLAMNPDKLIGDQLVQVQAIETLKVVRGVQLVELC